MRPERMLARSRSFSSVTLPSERSARSCVAPEFIERARAVEGACCNDAILLSDDARSAARAPPLSSMPAREILSLNSIDQGSKPRVLECNGLGSIQFKFIL